jgi:hypothetical protein
VSNTLGCLGHRSRRWPTVELVKSYRACERTEAAAGQGFTGIGPTPVGAEHPAACVLGEGARAGCWSAKTVDDRTAPGAVAQQMPGGIRPLRWSPLARRKRTDRLTGSSSRCAHGLVVLSWAPLGDKTASLPSGMTRRHVGLP